MSKAEQLYNLVQSLTKAEKRHFNLQFSGGKGKSYLHLFKVLDKMKAFDLEHVKAEMKKVSGTSNLSVTFDYLRNNILDGLASQLRANSPAFQLDRLVENGKVALTKGQHELAFDQLLKAEKLAKEEEDHIALIRIYSLMRKMMAVNRIPKNLDFDLTDLHDRMNAVAKEHHNYVMLQEAQSKFQRHMANRARTSDEETLRGLEAVLEEVDARLDKREMGFFPAIMQHQMHSQYHFFAGNMEKSYQHNKQQMELFHDRPKLAALRPKLAIGLANNLMIRCHRTGRYDELASTLEFVENFNTTDPDAERVRVETANMCRMFLISMDRSKAPNIIEKVLNDLDHYDGKMNHGFEMLIYCFLSTHYFILGDFGKGLRWINHYLNHDKRDAFASNLILAEVFRLFIFLEQKKIDLLWKELQQITQQYDENDRYPGLRQLTQDFLIPYLKDPRKELLLTYGSGLKKLYESETEPNAFEFFRFDAWVDSKLRGKRLSDEYPTIHTKTNG